MLGCVFLSWLFERWSVNISGVTTAVFAWGQRCSSLLTIWTGRLNPCLSLPWATWSDTLPLIIRLTSDPAQHLIECCPRGGGGRGFVCQTEIKGYV